MPIVVVTANLEQTTFRFQVVEKLLIMAPMPHFNQIGAAVAAMVVDGTVEHERAPTDEVEREGADIQVHPSDLSLSTGILT